MAIQETGPRGEITEVQLASRSVEPLKMTEVLREKVDTREIIEKFLLMGVFVGGSLGLAVGLGATIFTALETKSITQTIAMFQFAVPVAGVSGIFIGGALGYLTGRTYLFARSFRS